MFQTLKELKIFFSFKEKTKTYMSRFLTVAGLLLTPETCPSCVRFVAPTSSHPNFSHEYFLALLSKNEASPKALQLKNPVPDLPPPKGLCFYKVVAWSSPLQMLRAWGRGLRFLHF